MLALFLKFVRTRWKMKIAYPIPFVLGIVGQWTAYALEFAGMWIVISKFGTLGAWRPEQALFLYAMNLFCYAGGASFAFNPSRQLPNMVRTGAFDEILTKPVDSLLYLVSASYNLGYISHLSLGIAGMALSLRMLNLSLSVGECLWLVITLISGSAIHGSLMLLSAIPGIRIVGRSAFTTFYSMFRDLLYYPLSIFDTPLQVFLTFVVPFAFVNFYPSQILLNVADRSLIAPWARFLSPAVALLLVGLTIVAWRAAINHYESTGS